MAIQQSDPFAWRASSAGEIIFSAAIAAAFSASGNHIAATRKDATASQKTKVVEINSVRIIGNQTFQNEYGQL
jgi:hypothetical protein